MKNATTNKTPNNPGKESLLATLRAMLPNRPLTLNEALHLAERQATELLRLQGVTDVPVPTTVVTRLPHIVVKLDPMLPQHAASGASHWDSQRRVWVILLNPDEPRTRQRLTVLHEWKHILDHYHPGLQACGLPKQVRGLQPVEFIADYFAGCVLMPRNWVKAAYGDGIQNATDLAELFDVSPRAMAVRLQQLGLAADGAATTRYRLQTPLRRAQPQYRYTRPLSLRVAMQGASR